VLDKELYQYFEERFPTERGSWGIGSTG
jgi:hypothetical protein